MMLIKGRQDLGRKSGMSFDVHLTDTFQKHLKGLEKKYFEEELGYAYFNEPL